MIHKQASVHVQPLHCSISAKNNITENQKHMMDIKMKLISIDKMTSLSLQHMAMHLAMM